MFWYFVLFIIFGVFVTFNMIIGVILPHCQNLLAAMTSKRREKSGCSDSIATAAINGNVDNEITTSTESKIVKFARSWQFERISYFICWAYIILLMFDCYEQSVRIQVILAYADLLFGLLFIIETILRGVGTGIKGFFKNGWNIFDLLIVILFLVGKHWCSGAAQSHS